MSLTFAKATKSAIPLHVIPASESESWLSKQDADVAGWLRLHGFTGAMDETLAVPGPDGTIRLAVTGYGTADQRARGRFALASAAGKLPEGVYKIASGVPKAALETECLGWLLGAYRFDRYRSKKYQKAQLVAPSGIDKARIKAFVDAEVLTRDLINTPTSDMGPDALEAAARDLAGTHGATVDCIVGEDLIAQRFPMIHAVGRAAATPPRLIDMRWGTSGPKLTLVGKGVCFDTGGLDIKTKGAMALMKKDMGGAATVLGLAHMIMGLKLPVQLRILIPAVENAISGNAFRPGDILTSRKGLTVEINNTDAEGRLVLADALALAQEDEPDLLISMATLTGAARIAVGSDIAPFFTDDDAVALALSTAASRVGDPVWRLPFHEPYEAKIEPAIADLDNAPSSGFAGAITAALFLRRFAGRKRYVHFDIYAWQSISVPARPKGGLGQGARAILDALPEILGL